jgi:hypothetical protein
MANLAVTPGYLDKLASKQDDASNKANDAASAASGIEPAVWVTHGVISGASNSAFTGAERMRREAGKDIAAASSDLAAKLRTAGVTYAGVDDELGGNLDKQAVAR